MSIQRTSKIFMKEAALSKWPHLHRAYLVSGPYSFYVTVYGKCKGIYLRKWRQKILNRIRTMFTSGFYSQWGSNLSGNRGFINCRMIIKHLKVIPLLANYLKEARFFPWVLTPHKAINIYIGWQTSILFLWVHDLTFFLFSDE